MNFKINFFVFISVLLAALSKPAINEVFLVLVSYAIILTFFSMELCLALTSQNKNSIATGSTLVFVYLTYSMLPVRLREALIGGFILSMVHVLTIILMNDETNWGNVSFYFC